MVSVLQILPPAAVTCTAVQSQWNLVAAGTAHGLVLFDYHTQSPVLHKCTLNPNDLTGAGETLSRRKSFKKTLRESFRRLRKGRSTRNNPSAQATTPAETRPVERQIEARPVDDGMGSMVRCLTFAQTHLTNQQHTSATLWSGTNSSCVSVFILNVPPRPPPQPPTQNNEANVDGGDVPPPKPITGQLAKEIQLKHRAPVIAISLFDQHGVPLDFQSKPGPGPHKVLIASEEQFKVFSLPQLKPVNKYKLTAHEGARVRRIAFATFMCTLPASHLQASPSKAGSRTPAPAATESAPASGSPSAEALNASNAEPATAPEVPKHYEISLLCLTNLGDCLVLSVPELKRQLNAAAVRREDINGISSLCFTNHGEALYMMSSSEVQRITLSTSKIVSPTGYIELEDWSHEQDETELAVEADEAAATPEVEEPTAEKPIDVATPLSVVVTAINGTGFAGGDGLTNGVGSGDDASPNKAANETITSSIGDITIDSVRDHLNSTTTTLCSTTTEEIVGRLSVLSTHSNNVASSAKATDITTLNSSNIKDLKHIGDSTETASNSVIIKSVITTVKHGTSHVNGEHNSTTTTESSKTVSTGGGLPLLRKESQF